MRIVVGLTTLVLAGSALAAHKPIPGTHHQAANKPISGTSHQAAHKPVYRTNHQAATWLEHRLKSWHGAKVEGQRVVFAACANGYYSATEERTGRHFPGAVGKRNAAGEDVFPSFACSLNVGGRTFNLYLVPKRRGYKVSADR